MVAPDTRSALLAHAEALMRTRGYAAFSFADLAGHVAIRKASVHHHFASKEALGRALVQDYRRRFVEALAGIEADHQTAIARLQAFAAIFTESSKSGMLPLCCALAAERSALPESIAVDVRDFFQSHLEWLTRVVEQGIKQRELRHPDTAEEIALLLLSTLEGGSLVAWAMQDRAPVLQGFDSLVRAMRPTGRRP